MNWRWDGEKVICSQCGYQAMVTNYEKLRMPLPGETGFHLRTGEIYTAAHCSRCFVHEEFPTNPWGGYQRGPAPVPWTVEEKRAYKARLTDQTDIQEVRALSELTDDQKRWLRKAVDLMTAWNYDRAELANAATRVTKS
jgi:hypothetical protein